VGGLALVKRTETLEFLVVGRKPIDLGIIVETAAELVLVCLCSKGA
jgi:hypothetical protein